jgi:hypothetical protein
MADLPNVVRPCFNEAVSRAARLIERAAAHAAEALDREALARAGGAVDWRELQAASRELLRLAPRWRDTFPVTLRSALESPPPPRTPMVRGSSLTLVDDGDLMESIESARLAQEVAPQVEAALAELDLLMSAALGLDGVHPECNPLRPEVFTQALRRLMGAERLPSPGWPALWLRHMAEPLAHDLLHLYRASTKLLAQAGVRAADYRVLTGPAPLERTLASQPAPLEGLATGFTPIGGTALPAGGGRGSGAAGASVALLSHWLHTAFEAIRGPLVRDFLRGGGDARALPVGQPLASGYYARVGEELAELEAGHDDPPPEPADERRHAHLAPVDRPPRRLGTASALSTERWGAFGVPRQRSLVRTRLKQQAREVGQAMGLEVVRQLVDEVAQDPRLLAPVREAIVAVEPALGRLALHAPQFLGDTEHPARQLLEAVAVRSFRYNDEFDSGFASFFEPVRETFNALNARELTGDPDVFAQSLAALQAGWAEQDAAQDAGRAQVLEAVQFAERRQAEAEQIAWELSHRSDLEGAPALVQDFLFHTWALVLAHARLHHGTGQVDPGGFLGVVSDLLWSVKRDATLREPARAFELIPRTLAKVREGLDLLGQSPLENSTFFQALEQLHRPVLKLRAKHRKQVFEASVAAPLGEALLEPAAPQTPRPTEMLWLAPGELQVCGFEDTVPSDYAPLFPLEDFPDAAAASTPAASAVEATIAGLAEGAWVDLFSRQKWRRAQLVWRSSRGTLFMFVSEGRQPHSMTLRSLQRLVAARLLRRVDTGEVVQQALDALAQPRDEALAA